MTVEIVADRWRRGRLILADREVWHRVGPLLIVLVVWFALLAVLDLGWLPNDDGTMAEMAERVRSGQMPHLDFDDPYTGLLSYLNALAFGAFGENLLSLRYPYWLLVGLWMIVMLALARRILSPLESAVAVSAIAFGSVFTHISPMPTWYIMMVGTFAIFAAIRFLESQNRAWLVLAGTLVGLAFLVKSTGLVFGLGIGLALAVRAIRTGAQMQQKLGRGLMVGSLLLLVALVSGAPSLGRYLLLVLPTGTVCAVEWVQAPPAESRQSAGSILKEVCLVSVGAAIPIVIFGSWFWAHGALGELCRSLLLTPRSVIGDLQRDVATSAFLAVVVGVVLVLWMLNSWDARSRLTASWGLAAVALAGYLIWPRMVLIIAFAIVAWLGLALGFAYLWISRGKKQITVPLATVAIVCGGLCFLLVQYPASNLYYVVVGTPLVAIAVLHLGRLASLALGRLLIGVFVVIGTTFGMAKVQGRLFTWGQAGVATRFVMLEMPRGQLRVPVSYAYYNDLVRDVNALRSQDSVLVAGPDSPEVYFLAEFDNPTRILFDALSSDGGGPTTADYLKTVVPDMIVNNRRPIQSEALHGAISKCAFVGNYGPLELYFRCAR